MTVKCNACNDLQPKPRLPGVCRSVSGRGGAWRTVIDCVEHFSSLLGDYMSIYIVKWKDESGKRVMQFASRELAVLRLTYLIVDLHHYEARLTAVEQVKG